MNRRLVLMSSYMVTIGLTYLLFQSVSLSFLLTPSFAQDPRTRFEEDPQTESPARLNGAGEGQPRLEALDSDAPMLESISENGIFRVQLRWPQVPLNPDGAFQIQAVFLNASAPPASPETIPQERTNQSGQSPTDLGRIVIPEAIERRVPVTNYDMTIFSEDGRELWKAVNRPGTGGFAGERIILEEEYIGPVTIVIDNIIPGWDVSPGTGGDPILAGENEEIRDSVTFTARVIPEFQFFLILPLVLGISLVIAAMRTRASSGFNLT